MLCTWLGLLKRKFLNDNACEIFLKCRQNLKCQMQNIISSRMKHHVHQLQHQVHQLHTQVVRGQLCELILLLQRKMTRIRWPVTCAQKTSENFKVHYKQPFWTFVYTSPNPISFDCFIWSQWKCVTFRLIRKLSKIHLNVTTSTQKVDLATKK